MEEWKDIPNCKGYQASNNGKVKSISRVVWNGKGYYTIPEKILKPTIHKQGYEYLNLCINGKTKRVFVHRLVAETFIDNSNNYPIINHKDENKQNNNVDNLEWCTYEYNNNYGTHKGINKKKIIQLDKSDNEIKIWNSIQEASEYLSIPRNNIYCVLCRKRKSAGGYRWKYKD